MSSVLIHADYPVEAEDYTRGVDYRYGISPQIYLKEASGYRQVNPDQTMNAFGISVDDNLSSMMAAYSANEVFYMLPENPDLYLPDYTLLAGSWPERDTDCVLVLTSSGNIPDFLLYTMGFKDASELNGAIGDVMTGQASDNSLRAGAVPADLADSFKGGCSFHQAARLEYGAGAIALSDVQHGPLQVQFFFLLLPVREKTELPRAGKRDGIDGTDAQTPKQKVMMDAGIKMGQQSGGRLGGDICLIRKTDGSAAVGGMEAPVKINGNGAGVVRAEFKRFIIVTDPPGKGL